MRLTKTARVYSASIAVTAALSLMAMAPASASTASAGTAAKSGGTWANPQRVITPPTRRTFGSMIRAVSCSPTGYCAAIGSYGKPSPTFVTVIPYVVTEANGRWSKIKTVDLSSLDRTDTNANVDLVACPSAGNCSVIGDYTDTSAAPEPFTLTERNGTWGKAHAIPGFTTGIGEFGGFIVSLACTSAGNCVAGGNLGDSLKELGGQPLVVSEKNGVWGHAEDLPGTSGLNIVGGNVDSISCTGGTCLGVGTYSVGNDSSVVTHQFVTVAKHGVWGTARPIPGLPSDDANVGPVSCSVGGTCTVLASSSSSPTEFTLSEKNGRWNTRPNGIPGMLATEGVFNSLACPSAGNCSADGEFTDPITRFDLPFVATEHDGTWSKVELLPGLLRLNHHGKFAHQASIGDVSCGASGNCAAIGWANVNGEAKVTKIHAEALVVNEVAGRWHFAQVLPGIVTLERQGNSQGAAVACWSANHCAAGGTFAFRVQKTPIPFVVTER